MESEIARHNGWVRKSVLDRNSQSISLENKSKMEERFELVL